MQGPIEREPAGQKLLESWFTAPTLAAPAILDSIRFAIQELGVPLTDKEIAALALSATTVKFAFLGDFITGDPQPIHLPVGDTFITPEIEK